jgi:hypothetical protein
MIRRPSPSLLLSLVALSPLKHCLSSTVQYANNPAATAAALRAAAASAIAADPWDRAAFACGRLCCDSLFHTLHSL